ncbi:MAG: hypothetical protein WBD31_07800 [Rubripirellula sp.]
MTRLSAIDKIAGKQDRLPISLVSHLPRHAPQRSLRGDMHLI